MNDQSDQIETLKFAGEALYGSRWVSDLAASLGYSRVRVHQWISGARPIPADVWPRINFLAAQRVQRLQFLSHTVIALKSPD